MPPGSICSVCGLLHVTVLTLSFLAAPPRITASFHAVPSSTFSFPEKKMVFEQMAEWLSHVSCP